MPFTCFLALKRFTITETKASKIKSNAINKAFKTGTSSIENKESSDRQAHRHQVATQVIVMTTHGATSDEKAIKTTIPCFKIQKEDLCDNR